MPLMNIFGFMLALQAGGASVDTDTVDIADRLNKMMVLTDGKAHYLALLPKHERIDGKMPKWLPLMFYGDGQTFFRAEYNGGGTLGQKYWYRVIDPRFAHNSRPTLAWTPGKFVMQCGQRATEMKPLDPDEAMALLSKATFWHTQHPWDRYALLRDDRGTYFYVDRGSRPYNQKKFRVFMGPKGKLKQARLKNIVHDTQGDIFSTPTGNLRLVLSKSEGFWVSKKRRHKLTLIPLENNLPLIYNELGVYLGARLGLPCDDL